MRKRSKKYLLKLKPVLDQLVERMEVPAYIKDDPIQFLHTFDDTEEINVAGFFAAIMAWGRRSIVIAKIDDLLSRMAYRPVDFIGNFTELDARRIMGFKHRTFNSKDMYWFIKTMQEILIQYHSIESFWAYCYNTALAANRPLMGYSTKNFLFFLKTLP